MSSFVEIVIISLSLAMDSLSVSIAGGFKAQKAKIMHAAKVAAFFGGFQAGMPLLGWAIGELFVNVISQFAHWIAFGLLGFIGVKMIKEALDADEHNENNILQTKRLLVLAIATSIDALIVGITLSVLQIPLLISVSIIGTITFVLCFFGFLFGKKLGKLFGKQIEILGGIALLLIGCKILFEHLS